MHFTAVWPLRPASTVKQRFRHIADKELPQTWGVWGHWICLLWSRQPSIQSNGSLRSAGKPVYARLYMCMCLYVGMRMEAHRYMYVCMYVYLVCWRRDNLFLTALQLLMMLQASVFISDQDRVCLGDKTLSVCLSCVTVVCPACQSTCVVLCVYMYVFDI